MGRERERSGMVYCHPRRRSAVRSCSWNRRVLMKKFTCGHCGGRIAIPPRMMGQLVVCPDCGKPTHPLATEILAAAKDKPAERSLSAEPIERRCENCGRTIGRLEPLQVWDNHLVCAECHPRLARAAPSAQTREMTLPAAAPLA